VALKERDLRMELMTWTISMKMSSRGWRCQASKLEFMI